MKDKVRKAINKALTELGIECGMDEIVLDHPKNESFGDLATNAAMVFAGRAGKKPRELAAKIAAGITKGRTIFSDVQVAGPGFINFFLNERYWLDVVKDVNNRADKFGRGARKSVKVLVEFVSANPTGPLHIGHGRGAAVGDILSNLLKFAGYSVKKEYYVNDVGNQMLTLGSSVYARYKELFGEKAEYKKEYYQGGYIKDIASEIKGKADDKYLKTDEKTAIAALGKLAARQILKGIKKDLSDFGVKFDNWYSEKTLVDSGNVEAAIKELRARGIIYDADGAAWFKTTGYGDEKDRVVIKADRTKTYFASDIAYHKEKYGRGFDEIVDIWGADHHGYVPRISSIVQALGHDKESFSAILIQLVHMLKDGAPVSMSTRAGKFDTLKEVVDEVGKDAARYFFMMRKSDSHLNFDLELAKRKSSDNPVYYVQYAHARICSIFKNAALKKVPVPNKIDDKEWVLKSKKELNIIKHLWLMPETVQNAAKAKEPHRIAFYVYELASLFHSFYNKHRVLVKDKNVLNSRLFLVMAIKQVLKNCLNILGISAPEKM
jgi:arginyl-tRNA synthetase